MVETEEAMDTSSLQLSPTSLILTTKEAARFILKPYEDFPTATEALLMLEEDSLTASNYQGYLSRRLHSPTQKV